jgi:hypothetical protein
MKEIKYTVLLGFGNKETHKHGTVKDLLFDVPYFFRENDIIPSLQILNDFLQKGISDAGMSGGCRWKPFELDEQEYNELIQQLLTEPTRNLKLIKIPNHIQTYKIWISFRISYIKKYLN